MYQNIDRLIEEASIGAEKMVACAVNWIDRPKDRFWCPGCQKNQSHPEMVAPWIGPDGKLVCFYLVCKRCGKSGVDTFRAGDKPLSQRKVDMVECSLLSRYPHIAENLPSNYFESSKESEPEFLGNMIIPSPVQPSVDGWLPQVVACKYLVIRFLAYLGLDRDVQCKLIWHLGESYPLVTVCSNGEEPEGYEAWFKIEGWTEEACRLFMEEACKLGADPETFDSQCFVHLPNAINPKTGKVQTLVYLDTEGEHFPDGPTPLRLQRPELWP